MSMAIKDPGSHALKCPPSERLPKKNGPSTSVLPSEDHPRSWRPVTRRPVAEKLTLLQVMGGVWTFQDPGRERLYRCEIDPCAGERWSFKVVHPAGEWISQADAARLLGISRQAIRNAITYKRLRTVDCDGRTRVCKSEVLALKIDPKRRRTRWQSSGNAQRRPDLRLHDKRPLRIRKRESRLNRNVWNCCMNS